MFGRGFLLVALGPVFLSGAPAASADPLPDCGAQGPQTAPWSCQLRSHDSLGLRFEVGSGPEQGRDEHGDWRDPCQETRLGWRTEVRVVDPSGAVRQTFAQEGYKPPLFQIQDLDHDGRDELLVSPSWGGTGGNTWCVWRASGDSAHFEQAGEIFSASRIEFTEDRFVKWTSKSGAGGKALMFGRFVDGRMKILAEVGWAAPGQEDNKTDSWRCLLEASQTDLVALGMDEHAAQEHFCARELMWE